jgi:hypothetical protein|nr:MAG TPA: restriction alleviation protein [Podoviridae sp. ctgHy19]
MNALEFLKERKRMCISYKSCDGCPLVGTHCVLSHVTSDEDYESNAVETVIEAWNRRADNG